MNDWKNQFFYQLLLTSDESSSEDEIEFMYRGPIIPRPKIQDFVSGTVDRYSENEFRENFRMSRSTFDYILQMIEDNIATSIIAQGRHTINARIQLLVAIWHFSTPDSYRSFCGRFNIGKATGLRIIRRVTKALLKIAYKIICWPREEKLEQTKARFQEMADFPNVIGVIDGSYIPIPMPKEFGLSYICRKNFACVVLQGVCDHQMLFTHCYAGEVGSTHDARVLKRSAIWKYMLEDFDEKFPNDTHILGDKAYLCIPTLIVPFKDNGHLSNAQRNFNFKLSSTRSIIERAFALLKKRMRCLNYLNVKIIEWVPYYIIACCVLHNICIMQNDIFDIDMNIEPEEEEDNFPEERNVNRATLNLGIQKRNRLCIQLNQ